jgi:hypothetical protein
MENTTAKSLALIPRLLLGAFVGIFAGAVSGGLAGGFLFTGFGILVDLVTPDTGGNFGLADFVEAFKIMFTLGAYFGFPSAAAIGGLFGLLDGFLDSRLANSLNEKLDWVFTGAALGSIGGAVFLGLLFSDLPRQSGSSFGIGMGALFGAPAGAIAGPIFGLVYKPLATIGTAMKPATAS